MGSHPLARLYTTSSSTHYVIDSTCSRHPCSMVLRDECVMSFHLPRQRCSLRIWCSRCSPQPRRTNHVPGGRLRLADIFVRKVGRGYGKYTYLCPRVPHTNPNQTPTQYALNPYPIIHTPSPRGDFRLLLKGTRRGDGTELLWSAVLQQRPEHLAECGPDEWEVPEPEPVCLLRGQPY